jgi:hypothetical protein
LEITPKEILKEVISASIGEGIATEFLAFVKLQTQIDIERILSEPYTVREINGVDLKYSLIAGLIKKYEHKKELLDNMLEICSFLEAEYGVLFLKMMQAISPSYMKNNITKAKSWEKLRDEYAKYLLE